MAQDIEKKVNIEDLLEEGRTIQFTPIGTSMYPLFVTAKDQAIVAPVSDACKLKKRDVVLYRRKNGPLVIHRIYRINKEGVWLVGDHQSVVEGPLSLDCIKGVMVAFIRKGRDWSVKNPIYVIFNLLWMIMRPIRMKCIMLGHYCKVLKQKLLHKNTK